MFNLLYHKFLSIPCLLSKFLEIRPGKRFAEHSFNRISTPQLICFLLTMSTPNTSNWQLIIRKRISLRKKYPYSELFRSVFSRIWTEYGVSLRIQSECGKIRTRKTPNADNFYAVYDDYYFSRVIQFSSQKLLKSLH